MDYATPQEMRKTLAGVISSSAAIEAAVEAYFRKLELPKKAKPPTEERSKSRAKTYEEEMRENSDKLGAAIEAMIAGKKYQSPDSLKWTVASGADVITRGEPLYGEYKPRTFQPVRPAPCFRCGAANGCEHTA